MLPRGGGKRGQSAAIPPAADDDDAYAPPTTSGARPASSSQHNGGGGGNSGSNSGGRRFASSTVTSQQAVSGHAPPIDHDDGDSGGGGGAASDAHMTPAEKENNRRYREFLAAQSGGGAPPPTQARSPPRPTTTASRARNASSVVTVQPAPAPAPMPASASNYAAGPASPSTNANANPNAAITSAPGNSNAADLAHYQLAPAPLSAPPATASSGGQNPLEPVFQSPTPGGGGGGNTPPPFMPGGGGGVGAMQPAWYLPQPAAPPLAATQPIAWWLFLLLIIALFLTAALIYVNKIGYYNANAEYDYRWMQISMSMDFIGVSLLILVLAGWMMRCCQVYARATIHFLWHALIFLITGFCFDVQRYSTYHDLLIDQGYVLQAVGLACLYGVCVYTTTESLKSQHQISPMAGLLERELEMTARMLQEKERALEREQNTAIALKDELDATVRTRNALLEAKDKQLNALQAEYEAMRIKLRNYEKDNELLLDAKGKAYLKDSRTRTETVEMHKMTAYELREQNLQLSAQLAGMAGDMSALRKRAADAEDSKTRDALALKAARADCDKLRADNARLTADVERLGKALVEVESELNRWRAAGTNPTTHCLNCAEWERKYTQLSRTAVGSAKLAEERDLLMAERDRLKELVAKLQAKIAKHEAILKSRLGQMKGEINDFSRYATAVHKDSGAAPGGSGSGGGSGSAGSGGSAGSNAGALLPDD